MAFETHLLPNPLPHPMGLILNPSLSPPLGVPFQGSVLTGCASVEVDGKGMRRAYLRRRGNPTPNLLMERLGVGPTGTPSSRQSTHGRAQLRLCKSSIGLYNPALGVKARTSLGEDGDFISLLIHCFLHNGHPQVMTDNVEPMPQRGGVPGTAAKRLATHNECRSRRKTGRL